MEMQQPSSGGDMRIPPHLLVLSALLAFIPPAQAYTGMSVGVASNLLVDHGRVIFVQADHTLTALDLQSGRVLARIPRPIFGNPLVLTDAGILSSTYGHVALMDRQTLAIIWEASSEVTVGVLALQRVLGSSPPGS